MKLDSLKNKVVTLLLQVTPNVIPQRNATFWKKDVQLNKEYEKTIVENNLENVSSTTRQLKDDL